MTSDAVEDFATLGDTWPSRAERWLETQARKIVVTLLAGLFAAAIIEDIRAPLWTDELITLYVTQQPTIPDVLAAIRDGVDSQPPLYDLIVRSLSRLIANDALRVRLPSTIGFFLMCVCLFVFVRKRLPAIYALLAMLVAARTTWSYAFEGRSYGMVLGCVGLALVCWQAGTETGQRHAIVGLAVSLAGAIAFHYFAVFVVSALLMGELVRWWNSRRLDFPILAATALPSLVLLLHLPLIRAGKSYIKYFWSKPQAETLYIFYVQVAWPVLLVLLLAVVCPNLASINRKAPLRKVIYLMPIHELATAVTLTLLPEIVILASLLTVNVFVNRYVIWSMIGMGVWLAAAIHRRSGGSGGVAAIVMLPLVVWSASTIIAAPTKRWMLRYGEELKSELAKVRPEPRPIVFFSLHAFMELWFYSEPNLRARFVYLISPELERYYTHTDTGSLILLALGRRVPMGIANYDAFIAVHPAFIVAGNSGEWIVPHLRSLNYQFVPVAQGANPKLYEVEAPAQPIPIEQMRPTATRKLP